MTDNYTLVVVVTMSSVPTDDTGDINDALWALELSSSHDGHHGLTNSTAGPLHLQQNPESSNNNSDDDYEKDDNGHSDDDDDFPSLSTRGRLYTFRPNATATASFRLYPLPSDDGVMGPVGGDVWHAAALLASLPLRLSDANCVLEIGSGAVGLSGLCLAQRMMLPSTNTTTTTTSATYHWHNHVDNDNECHNEALSSSSEPIQAATAEARRLILTDVPDHGIVNNLRKNVQQNISRLYNHNTTKSLVDVLVQTLDWTDETALQSLPTPLGIDALVGSELVYSPETGHACATLLKRLLRQYPNLQCYLVQVHDRPGWQTFLHTLLSKQDPTKHDNNNNHSNDEKDGNHGDDHSPIQVRTLQPLPPEWHDQAVVLLGGKEALGTPSRLDYSLCWINKRTAHPDKGSTDGVYRDEENDGGTTTTPATSPLSSSSLSALSLKSSSTTTTPFLPTTMMMEDLKIDDDDWVVERSVCESE